MIRVLQVFGSLNMGGAESRMMDIYRHIDKSKVQFDFVTLTDGEQCFVNEIRSLGGKIYYLKSPRDVGIWNHIKDLRKCLRENTYHAVHAHTSYHCGLVMLAAWLEKVGVRVAHARTTGTQKSKKGHGALVALGRIMCKLFATHRFAISKEAGKYVFGSSSFDVVPNTIEVEKYLNITDKERIEYKAELGIGDNCFVIGQIGRFDSMKNQQFSVKWFDHYIKDNPQSELVFVGDGLLRPQIEQLVDQYGIKDKVIFTGVRKDVNRLIHIFNVLLFPSVYEGLGVVSLEAQAAGVPVVQSDTIPLESDIGVGMVKRCSLSEDYETWKKAVEESKQMVIPDAETRKEAFYIKGYSIEAVVNKYQNTYEG